VSPWLPRGFFRRAKLERKIAKGRSSSEASRSVPWQQQLRSNQFSSGGAEARAVLALYVLLAPNPSRLSVDHFERQIQKKEKIKM